VFPAASGIARKLKLSFNGNPSTLVCGRAQLLSHETTIAKANAAATTCRLEEPVPDFEKVAANMREHVDRATKRSGVAGAFWRSRQGEKEQRACIASSSIDYLRSAAHQ